MVMSLFCFIFRSIYLSVKKQNIKLTSTSTSTHFQWLKCKTTSKYSFITIIASVSPFCEQKDKKQRKKFKKLHCWNNWNWTYFIFHVAGVDSWINKLFCFFSVGKNLINSSTKALQCQCQRAKCIWFGPQKLKHTKTSNLDTFYSHNLQQWQKWH